MAPKNVLKIVKMYICYKVDVFAYIIISSAVIYHICILKLMAMYLKVDINIFEYFKNFDFHCT